MRDHLDVPVHFLEGLRCPNCLALDASRLVLLAEADAGAVVECGECGAMSRVLITETGEAA
jgi:Zn ribbon nucleic-acid-binding protein